MTTGESLRIAGHNQPAETRVCAVAKDLRAPGDLPGDTPWMRRVLFLDIDGVLNRTGFSPPSTNGMRDWIEPELAARLAATLETIDAQIVLSTSWRVTSSLEELRADLDAAGIDGSRLLGATPLLEDDQRWAEIDAWMREHGIAPEAVVIVEDFYAMGPLATRTVTTSADRGLDEAAASAIVALFAP
jgi:hypothetical protein